MTILFLKSLDISISSEDDGRFTVITRSPPRSKWIIDDKMITLQSDLNSFSVISGGKLLCCWLSGTLLKLEPYVKLNPDALLQLYQSWQIIGESTHGNGILMILLL